jgi:hypothetical protein
VSEESGYRERARATHWAENHPMRDGVRQAIFHALCRLIDDDCVFYWSVLRLHWRTAFAPSTITSVLAEFVALGLLVDTGERKGKGGTRVYRLHYERSATAYPDSEDWATFKTRTDSERAHSEAVRKTKVHREPVKFNGTEPHREPVKFEARTAHQSHSQDDPNFTDPGSELHRSGGRTSPIGPTELHRLDPQTSPAGGDKVLEVLTEGFEENPEDAHRRAPSPVSQAKPGPRGKDRSATNDTTITAATDALLDAFEKLRRSGACAWPRKGGSKASIRAGFAELAARGATPGMVCEAAMSARDKLARSGNQPGPRSILAAMRVLMGGVDQGSTSPDAVTQEKQTRDKRFFDEPAHAAGTFTMPGNSVRH